ncbi:hypothetical protein OG921_25070 [Aldersonia sp. NBC_00410]|uniref:hypothetical protein n=1 Tax=Aldersonia sp. NBC_00410 TaxID=2975954 RepID=UPI0022574CBE|nr:hypothetical protein [Aldersonia sp. NBC_00410]MCX5046447.1 hypothetical protein [Aldersonia sp. NBC_00410]
MPASVAFPADDSTRKLAERLLDAQVAFHLAELDGERLSAVVDRDVREALRIAETVTVAQALDREHVVATVRTIIDLVGGSALPVDLADAWAGALYDLDAADEHRLGDVVDREQVDALVATVLSMHTLHEHALDRLTDSPLVASVATSFFNKIVGDIVAQNRALAEKVPGMGSMFSLGMGAVSRVKNVSDQFLGDVAGKGAQYALRRLNGATLELIRDAPLADAAMQVWDLQAEEPMSVLREYLSRTELTELIGLIAELAVTSRNAAYIDAVVVEWVDVFFARYGEKTVTALLGEAGVSSDDLVAEVQRHAPGIVAAAKADGRLAELIRVRLAPFYASDEVLGMLATRDD